MELSLVKKSFLQEDLLKTQIHEAEQSKKLF